MAYREVLKVRVSKINKTVSLSVRHSDQVVVVYSFPIAEFQKMVNEFLAQLK